MRLHFPYFALIGRRPWAIFRTRFNKIAKEKRQLEGPGPAVLAVFSASEREARRSIKDPRRQLIAQIAAQVFQALDRGSSR